MVTIQTEQAGKHGEKLIITLILFSVSGIDAWFGTMLYIGTVINYRETHPPIEPGTWESTHFSTCVDTYAFRPGFRVAIWEGTQTRSKSYLERQANRMAIQAQEKIMP